MQDVKTPEEQMIELQGQKGGGGVSKPTIPQGQMAGNSQTTI
jgi:hypothetical protein